MEPTVWFSTSPKWSIAPENHKAELLSPKRHVNSSHDVSLTEIVQKSSIFPRKFPIESVRCDRLIKNKFSKQVLERNINSAYPVIHEHALYLCSAFLIHQKKFGNRKFYENMTLLDLIDRFLSKRAVSFVGVHDAYMLMDGTEGHEGWETVGTTEEQRPLILKNCLSYDEMKLSALLSVSSHTVFINDGNRRNCGVFENARENIEDEGVIIGLIGPRLPRRNVMEYREVVISKEQNNVKNGYGNFFVPTLQGRILNFYGSVSLEYEELLPLMKKYTNRYVEIRNGMEYFDKLIYTRRIALSIDTLLIEANDRARRADKMAYIHVVGLGLGVWKIYQEQDKLFMDTFAQRLKLLLELLTNISDVCFAYINHKMADEYKHGDKIGNIKLHMINKKGPHVKLTGEDAGKLLVVSYAWDSNSLPGNEFWFGSLDTSSDPAAACSTQVTELHNWHINPKCSARNLRIATLEGLVTFHEYQKMHEND